MNKEPDNPQAARSWRDIPQPVKSRQMSRGGRWRRVAHGLRVAMAVAVAGGVAWGGWSLWGALAENPRTMPAAARAVPVQRSELKTDGTLDQAWLDRTLALPKTISLMELDLQALRARVMADGQVRTATLLRRFPDTLVVQVTERTPIARVMADLAGERQPLLVARDGAVFFGAGYEAAMLDTLPWLDGVAIVRRGQRFEPVAGMDLVGDLLGRAKLEAEHLYRTWHVVSLARLESDREIEVRTRAPLHVTVVFGAHAGDDGVERERRFRQQLAKLDELLDSGYLRTARAANPTAQVRIDLSFGPQVPVRLEEANAAPAKALASPVFSIFPPFSNKTKS